MTKTGCVIAATGGFLLGSAVAVYLLQSIQSSQKRSRRSSLRTRTAAAALSEHESINFLADLLDRLWPNLKVAAENMTRDIILESLPSNVHIVKIDLGPIPIQMDNILFHPRSTHNDMDCFQMDLDVIWDSDCDMQFKADYLGNFGVQSIQLEGRMTVLFQPLSDELPCISAVQYAFVNPPSLQLKFTGLAQVAQLGVLASQIQASLHDAICASVVLPVRKLYRMDLNCDYRLMFHKPLGILHLTLVQGSGFVEQSMFFGTQVDVPDCYCRIRLGAGQAWKTRTIQDSIAPVWNQTREFVVWDYEQLIVVEAFDEDQAPLDADDELGVGQLTVGELLLAGRQTVSVDLCSQNRPTNAKVQLKGILCPLTHKNLDSFTSTNVEMCGMLSIVVTKASGLKVSEPKSFVKVTHGEQSYETAVVEVYPGVDALNPIYDAAFHVPLTVELWEKQHPVVLELMNGKELLGSTQIKMSELVQATNFTISKSRPVGKDAILLEFQVSLRGLQLPTAGATAGGLGQAASTQRSVPDAQEEESGEDTQVEQETEEKSGSANKIRITVLEGYGFKVQKSKGLFRKPDVPDIYLELQVGSSVWRTATIRNNIKPVWNESHEFTYTNQNQAIRMDVMDEEKNKPPEELGQCRCTVGKCLLEGGTVELPVTDRKGEKTGATVVLRCELLND